MLEIAKKMELQQRNEKYGFHRDLVVLLMVLLLQKMGGMLKKTGEAFCILCFFWMMYAIF